MSALPASNSFGSGGGGRLAAGSGSAAGKPHQAASIWGDVVEAAGKKAGLRHTTTAKKGQMVGVLAASELGAAASL